MKAKVMTSMAMSLALVSTFLLGTMRWDGIALAFNPHSLLPYDQYMKLITAEHKAPFMGKVFTDQQQFQEYVQKASSNVRMDIEHKEGKNVRVNQDHNPWPKVNVAAAVNPRDARNVVVVNNDTRQYFSHPFYHVSLNGGENWSDDTIAGPMNPTTSAAYSYTSDADVAFDLDGHSLISSVSGNVLMDFQSNYANFDTQINLSLGYQGGVYTDNTTTAVTYLPCNGRIEISNRGNCQGQLDQAHVAIDTVADSPTKNRIYIYYSYFCSGRLTETGPQACLVDDVSIPARSSAILETHTEGLGQRFSKPSLVSGSLTQVQFSSMVIDQHGVPHIFFEDFSASPAIQLYEATLFKDSWSVFKQPVASFSYLGLNNPRWSFAEIGTVAPSCALYSTWAYCAFTASRISEQPALATPQIYLASVDIATGKAIQVQRVNNDAIDGKKQHFFPWAVVNSKGYVYVGWYDNRRDASGRLVEYFVGMSKDGGSSFEKQQAVSDAAFDPCVGFPSCSHFNDYNQLAIGPDDVVRAFWTDTRDGATQQVYSQGLKWSQS
jgi:hypothetical protein